ncbi:MarR family winged helix-turn-helix transcriptional regulator [Aquabacterium sp.]|uniref:MarR family winged helix-turn-helix transcriptional regulator n=1 Tax=Aquabacterium sp. TaxID=1872578 RepID=UPI002C8865C2|nr:MarR family winged helix-turn-helix transcriptional regulator [Aquabacterium sp.]HSW04636.1 MarR family winged helix-turn-helix transcriptional regulator [Aquabacterium sp.]
MPTTPRRQDISEPVARVLRRFRVVLNAVKTHFQQVEKRAGIGGAQVWALSVIREQPGLGVNDLARAMGVHQSTASNLVKALVALHLISARKEGADRRTVQLRMLPAGTRVLRKVPGPFHGALPDALARLDQKMLVRLDKDLAVLVKALAPDGLAGGVPLARDSLPHRAG